MFIINVITAEKNTAKGDGRRQTSVLNEEVLRDLLRLVMHTKSAILLLIDIF